MVKENAATCMNDDDKSLSLSGDGGRYCLVGWDVDTTGRRWHDEICQIAAYTPQSTFAQYIMPYVNLNPLAQRRHNIQVMTIHYYRMLKDLKTNKFLRTKSEISALLDFLQWLEAVVAAAAADGVILVCHESRKMAPALLLLALHRYNLQDRFAAVVKGFANSYQLAERQCAHTMKSFSLKVLTRVLLDKNEISQESAADRAHLCYLIVQHLAQSERQDLDNNNEPAAIQLVRQFTNTVQQEQFQLDQFQECQSRQQTLRPIFRRLLAANWSDHCRGLRLRNLLVNNHFDYEQLQKAWKVGGRSALADLIRTIPTTTADDNEKERDDLLELLDCHFDPDKKPVEPKRRFFPNRRRQKENVVEKEQQDSVKSVVAAQEENNN